MVSSIGQNPSLSLDFSGDDDCQENNISASIILPESISGTNVQYKLDDGAWQSSNIFSGVSPWQQHQFYARLPGCFEAQTTQFVSELRPPRFEGIERAKDTDCIPANNEIRVLVPEGSDAQVQYNHTGAWYNPGQWVGPLSDGLLHIRVRSAYLPSCYQDTSIALSEHGSVSLAGANVSNTADCIGNNIQVQIQTNPSLNTGLEYFVEGKGWQSSRIYSGLSVGDKRIAIRSAGLCQVTGVSADTLTLSETIPPQIATIVPHGHDDCVPSNAGFTVYLNQSVAGGVRFRINGGTWQEGNLFTNLAAGSYMVEVSLADGTCLSGQSFGLVETGSVHISGITRFNENDCVVGNARLQVLHTGGNQEGLKFRLNGGAWQDSALFRNLSRMAVLVEAQIQKEGCTSAIVAWADSIREQSDFPEVANIVLTNDKDCTAGNARVTFSLKAPMTATYWLSPVKNNTTGVFTGLASGTYTFKVYKNSTGCVQTHVVGIDEKMVFTPDSVQISGANDCLNNNAQVILHHPYGPDAGWQFREVSRNTLWQSSTVFSASVHGQGVYNLEARNANGCTRWSGSVYVQERLNPEISGVLGIDGLSDCALGNVTAQVQVLNASAGSTRRYRLNGLGEWTSNSSLPGFRHGNNRVELSYYYTEGWVSKQCIISKDIVIDEKAREITGVSLDAALLNDCIAGNAKATIQVDGTTNNLRYVVTGKTEGTSNVFTNLNTGQYRAIIRDVVTTCRDTFNFSVAETPLLSIPAPNVQAVVCYGQSTGSVGVTPTGGLAPYTYLWSTGGSSASISGLAAGSYTVTVMDSRGCSQSQTAVVSGPAQNNLPQISFSGDTSICAGSSFSLSASGGNSYAWNTGAGSSSISGSPGGTTTYTVTVTNSLGCSSVAHQRVRVNVLPSPSIEGINVICAGQSTTLTAIGGSTYAWQHGPTTASIIVNPTSTTTYKVTVTNAEGCSDFYNRTVRVNPKPVADIQGIPAASFCGDTTLTLTGLGGSSYRWSTGETTSSIQLFVNSNQAISLIVKNSHACADTITELLSHRVRPLAQVVGGSIACYGASTTLTAASAATYLWSTNATTSSISIPQPTQSATYTVTLSNGEGCSVEVSREVKVPDSLSLNYTLTNDLDCIAKNVVITPQASGGSGSKSFQVLRSGELYPYTQLSGWGSGEYVLVVRDSLDCVASKGLSIIETPVKISKVNLLDTADCVPGNTRLGLEIEGNRFPMTYRLNGAIVPGPNIPLPPIGGNYRIEVLDSVGCVATLDQYYPSFDSLLIFANPISDCALTDGSIQFNYEGSDISTLSFSIDGGLSWQAQNNTFNGLSKGQYLPKVRNLQTGCEVSGDTLQISAPECYPSAAFTKDTLYIREPQQRVVLPWHIARNGYQDTLDYALRIGREGDGSPHFTDPNIYTLNEPQLRAANPIHFKNYPFDFAGGADSLTLTLQDSAQLYRSPAAYVFQLETVPGSNLRIDPVHSRLVVYVNFTDSVIIERKEVVLCSGIQQVTLGEDLGEDYCYAWEGPVSSNLPLLTISPTQNGEYKLNIIRNRDFKIYKTIIYSVKVESKQVQITSSGNLMCEGAFKILGVRFSDGGAIDLSSWAINWTDGNRTIPRVVRPLNSTTFELQLKNLVSGCVMKDTIRIQVLPKPNYVNILPTDAFMCNTPFLELEIDYPRTDSLNYFWSNGTRNFKTKVFQAGNYYVDVAYKVMPSCYRRIFHQVKEGIQVKIQLDSSGICPDSLPISAQIIRPNANSTYQFTWNTGQSRANVFSDGMHDKYVVTVTEEGTGCEGRDSVNVLAVLERMEEKKAQKISEELSALGFRGVPCTIIPSGLTSFPSLRDEKIVDYAGNVSLEIQGTRFNLSNRLRVILDSLEQSTLSSTKGYISPDCPDKLFKKAYQEFSQNSSDYKILTRVVKGHSGGSDMLYILADETKIDIEQFIAALTGTFEPENIVAPRKLFFLLFKKVLGTSVIGKDTVYYVPSISDFQEHDRLEQFIKASVLREDPLFPYPVIRSAGITVIDSLNGIEFEGLYAQEKDNTWAAYNPSTLHNYTWSLNGESIRLPNPYDFNKLKDLTLKAGQNSLRLVVKLKSSGQTLADITAGITVRESILVQKTALDSFRVVAKVKDTSKNYTNNATIGLPSKGDTPIRTGDTLSLKLQILDRTTRGWIDLDQVQWAPEHKQATNAKEYTEVILSTNPKPIKLEILHSQMKKPPFFVSIEWEDSIPKTKFLNAPLKDSITTKHSATIDSLYNISLELLRQNNPGLYNYFVQGNTTSLIVNVVDCTSPHLKIETPPGQPTRVLLGNCPHTIIKTPNYKNLFLREEETVKIISGLAIYKNAILSAKLNENQINFLKTAIRLSDSSNSEVTLLLAKLAPAPYVDSLRQAIRSNRLPRQALLNELYYDVAEEDVGRFARWSQPVNVYLNWCYVNNKNPDEFRKTLAHELTHAQYPFLHPVVKLKWKLINEKSESGRYGLGASKCSIGSGHEQFNPEDDHTCNVSY